VADGESEIQRLTRRWLARSRFWRSVRLASSGERNTTSLPCGATFGSGGAVGAENAVNDRMAEAREEP
jgi:hypothetical protein